MPRDVIDLIFRPDGTVVNETNADPSVPRVTGHQRYWIGVDLGQANDFSAVCVILDEQLPVAHGGRIVLGQRTRTVVYADRFKGVSYPAVADHITRLRNAHPFGGKSELVIDGTSLGRVVSDLLDDQGVDHHAVQMVVGQNVARKGKYYNAGKTLLIETASVMFASGELTFAEDLPLRREIEEDLASFTLTTTAAGNQVIAQSRSASGHGDMAIALIIAAWASQEISGREIEVRPLRNYYG